MKSSLPREKAEKIITVSPEIARMSEFTEIRNECAKLVCELGGLEQLDIQQSIKELDTKTQFEIEITHFKSGITVTSSGTLHDTDIWENEEQTEFTLPVEIEFSQMLLETLENVLFDTKVLSMIEQQGYAIVSGYEN